MGERVRTFLPIEGNGLHVWLDTAHVKTRQNGLTVSVAVIIEVAMNTEGRRDVLGVDTVRR